MSELKRRIRMYDGRLVDPFDLQITDVEGRAEVYMHSICLINRYTGATKYPYSVGQHSLILSHVVPDHLQKAAFVHDWSEALFNDIASPVKRQFQNYCDAEEAAQKVIFQAIGLPWELMADLDPYDKRIYKNERDILFQNIESSTVGMNDRRVPLEIDDRHFREIPWRVVREESYMRFEELFK